MGVFCHHTSGSGSRTVHADDPSPHSEVVAIARDADTCFLPMLMGYRFLFGGFLVPELPFTPPPTSGARMSRARTRSLTTAIRWARTRAGRTAPRPSDAFASDP